jgi:hypothetical protein
MNRLYYLLLGCARAQVCDGSQQIVERISQRVVIVYRSLQVAFLVRAGGMISFGFYLVLENVFAVSAGKFNEQKRPAKVFGD